MLVKINRRGKGGSAGPIDYLLGKERKRQHARVLRGDVEQTAELIDSLNFARNYTSGTLSFAESDVADDIKEKIMSSFEHAVFTGLDRDQWDCLWIEHKDKGRLELNFLIPNVELTSGKRLQPYFDAADRTRINAWQTVINGQLDLADPHDPARSKAVTLPSGISKDRKQTVNAITNAMMNLIEAGVITDRAGIIKALTDSGFEVTRETKGSISIRDKELDEKYERTGKKPRPIRLKGEIYERDFEASTEFRENRERAIKAYREERQQRVEQAKQTYREASATKQQEHRKRYQRPQQEKPRSVANSIVQSDSHINNRRSAGRDDSRRTLSVREQDKLNNINRWIEHHERYTEATRFSFAAITASIRSTVRRLTASVKRAERTADISYTRPYPHQRQRRRKQQRGRQHEKNNQRTLNM